LGVEEKMEQQQHMFTNRMIRNLLIPVVLEQLLNSIMGTADTMMVSNVGSAAISAVSLVDSINVLVIQAFSALAAGGAIVCAQYIGQRNKEKANESARQVLFIITAISAAVSLICLVFQKPLLRLIFGSVEAEVMRASETYFFYTALSFPFIAAYDSAASIFRAQDNTKGPMLISMISNVMNIAGNAVMIWGFHMGVAGAALSTLISRVFCAVVVLIQLRKDRQEIVVRDYIRIRPNWSMIKRILGIGIPSGVENSMFQLGKLAIQSTVSTLGTAAIAAQAMTNILENLNGIAAIGVGVGLMTIVGQCLGAGRQDEAVYYIKKLCVIAEVIIIISCLGVFALTKPITILGGMEKESADMCFHMMMWITIVKPLVWIMAFIPGYGLRAAGDVKFSMITSCCTMWVCRFCLCVFLIRRLGFGPMGVWIGMFADWTVRSIIFTWRFHSRKWLRHKVI
jgi:putative MATE family efflux protein